MKKKLLKNISILFTTIMTFMLSSGVVMAGTFTLNVEGNVVNPDGTSSSPTSIRTVGTTHRMWASFDGGALTSVYCAYHSKDLPVPLTNATYEIITNINDRAAMGAAKIITYDLSGYLSSYNNTTVQERREQVLKTIALNVYLTKATGVNRFQELDGGPMDNYTLLWWASSPLQPFVKGEINIDGLIEKFKTSEDADQKKVYELYEAAKDATTTGNANIVFEWDSSRIVPFELDSNTGIYTGTYYIKHNLTDGINGLNATVTSGLSDSSLATVTTDDATGKVVVSFHKDSLSSDDITSVRITATAKTNQKKALFYKLANSGPEFQDIVAESQLADINLSTDVPVDVQRVCYRIDTSCDSTTCDNTDTANERTCTATVTPYPAATCENEDVTEYGELTATYSGGACSLYCEETATATYPGNIGSSILMGTPFTWPTKGPDYPLTTSSTLTCTIVGSSYCSGQFATSGFTYENDDISAMLIYDDTLTDIDITLNQECTMSYDPVATDNTVKIYQNCEYTLPDGKNTAVNLKTYKFVDDLASAFSSARTDFLILTEYGGKLPVGGFQWIATTEFEEITTNLGYFDFGEKFKLQIKDLPLGYDGRFTDALNATDYTCNYTVTSDASGGCNCPPGTYHVGMDVSDLAQTCAEAQNIYCNAEESRFCNDTNGNKRYYSECDTAVTTGALPANYTEARCKQYLSCSYCVDTNNTVRPYSECTFAINGPSSERICQMQLDCNECPECRYYCPEGTDNYPMEITDCVNTMQVELGVSAFEAEKICVDSKCNSGNGLIIYRTISLENPFPSMNSDTTVTQNGLSVGMFNDTIKGRYPGSNWNSVNTVREKILNNRGYDGSDIYQEADPLYVIELDAKAIKEIREYNERQSRNNLGGYGDFTLECADGSGAYCISKFLHNSGITTSLGNDILTGGTCKDASNKAEFRDCYITRGGN